MTARARCARCIRSALEDSRGAKALLHLLDEHLDLAAAGQPDLPGGPRRRRRTPASCGLPLSITSMRLGDSPRLRRSRPTPNPGSCPPRRSPGWSRSAAGPSPRSRPRSQAPRPRPPFASPRPLSRMSSSRLPACERLHARTLYLEDLGPCNRYMRQAFASRCLLGSVSDRPARTVPAPGRSMDQTVDRAQFVHMRQHGRGCRGAWPRSRKTAAAG